MRITKNEQGEFVVEDELMRLDGEAAEKFLEDMKARDEAGPNSGSDRFLTECDEACQRTLAAMK